MKMSLNATLLTALVAGLTALPAVSQGAIRAGNVDFSVDSVPDSISSNLGRCSFTAHRGATTSVLFHHWIYYRVAGDPQEYPLNKGDTNGDSNNTQGFVENYSGNTAILAWTDVDERQQLSATWKITVYSADFNKGVAVSQVTWRNISNQPISLNTYSYVDFDVFNNQNSATGDANGNRHLVVHASSNIFSEFLGIGMDRYEVLGWDILQRKLIDGVVDDLSNLGLPWPTGDYTGAFQWQNRQLLPGQSATYTSLLTYRWSPCATEASGTTYGTGSTGSNGIPTLTTLNRPIINIQQPTGMDTFPKLQIAGGANNATCALLAGFGRTNTPVGNVTLYTNSIASIPIALDASGAATATLNVPNDPTLCGLAVDFQALIVDPGVVGLFPVSHTAGHEWILGGY